MIIPVWIWYTFTFAVGSCIGSFLNVIIYRMPRDKSIVTPPSSCPACGKLIRFYDNIPLISWLILAAKCRYCKAPISPRYFIIELLTGVLFIGMYILYFQQNINSGVSLLRNAGLLIYLVHIILLSALIASSAIDIELWIIPLSICWFATAVGILASTFGVYVIDPSVIKGYFLLPSASAKTAALSAGAAIGMVISLILLATGAIKRSYESDDTSGQTDPQDKPQNTDEPKINHRLEMCREMLFLMPIIICSVAALLATQKIPALQSWWLDFSQIPAIAGLLGSLWGYFIGCGIVWCTRIFGTLAFGKEAMGLGDVHLMGAAGTIVGPVFVFIAFFVAPFFGLLWAATQMFFRKIRQIPYGPFLSLAIFIVIILHDEILNYLNFVFFHR
ncbi:MAG: prepilin peptidase [Planctomycetes bacterium]|nr:prepilin peptidase [Planctomycetota bacterium]